MAVLSIPTSTSLPDYTMRLTLDGESVTARFRWNTRMEAWFLDLYDSAGDLLVAGIRCVLDTSLAGRFRYKASVPQGHLIAYDSTATQADPALEDFGTRVGLLYFETAEGLG